MNNPLAKPFQNIDRNETVQFLKVHVRAAKAKKTTHSPSLKIWLKSTDK